MTRFCLLVLTAMVVLLAPTDADAGGRGTSGDPFTSLSDAYKVPSSGRYFFNTGSGTFEADVDNSEGGGWVLVLQYVHQGGTNPTLSILGAGSDLPITSTAALGTDESADTARWGHAGNAGMSQFTGDIELRWYGETNAHSRIIHFRSSVGDSYVRTGTGDFSGIESSFTALTGHSANLPASAVNHNADNGDFAFAYEPFYVAATYHWNLDFLGVDRWEVDDYPNDSSQDTIHRVWVRDAAGPPLVPSPVTGHITSWNTTLGDGDETVELLVHSGSDNYDVYWGDGTVTIGASGNISHTYASAGAYDIEVVGDFSGYNFIFGGDVEKLTGIKQWGNIAFERLDLAFAGASNLSSYTATDAPDLSLVTSLSSTFGNASQFNGDLSNWDVSTINVLSFMFSGATAFNGDITTWDVRNVTRMDGMFSGATSFNQDITGWETGNVQDMFAMFLDAQAFNRNINRVVGAGNNGGIAWDTGNVTDMSQMFRDARNFNGDISDWDVGRVENLSQMFDGATAFDQPIGNWDVRAALSMTAMFRDTPFNQDIGRWETGNVQAMNNMFINATAFDQDISAKPGGGAQGGDAWDVSNVTNMTRMFQNAEAFDGPIGNWDTSLVGNMFAMFDQTESFDQDIGSWNISSVFNMSNMFEGTLSIANYNATLNGWASQTVQVGVTLGAYGLSYSSAGKVGRDTLTGAPSNWSIVGDTFVSDFVVTNTADSGVGSLRNAIEFANASGSAETITFNISGTGPFTIQPASAFPVLTGQSVTIDGTTQSGTICGTASNSTGGITDRALQIVLDGSLLPASTDLLSFDDLPDVTIQGLVLVGSTEDGVRITDSYGTVVVLCSHFGVDATGLSSFANTDEGLRIDGAVDMVIGDGTIAGANVFSGNGRHGLWLSNTDNGQVLRNFIGVGIDGQSDLGNASNGINAVDSGYGSLIEIGDASGGGNIISGNGADGLYTLNGEYRALGNFIGTDGAGASAVANAAIGINASADTLRIGNASSGGGNVISGNVGAGIRLRSYNPDVQILGNYIGLSGSGATALGNGGDGVFVNGSGTVLIGNASGGGNAISGNGDNGIEATGVTTSLTILGNHIGLSTDGNTALGNGGHGIEASNNTGLVIGSTSAGNRFAASSISSHGIMLTGSGTTDVVNNTFNLASNDITPIGSSYSPIWIEGTASVTVGDGTAAGSNTITGGSSAGIVVIDSAISTILANSIYGNGGIGIDLAASGGAGGVTANDSGDGDSGGNNLLNYPVIQLFTPTAGNVEYSIELDAPAETNGYRVDFYKSTTADPSGYGEGETWLGSVDTGIHTGVAQTFVGSFTPVTSVSAGEPISATATRKTSASTYAETSEFSLVVSGTADLSIMVASAVYDPAGSDLKAVPQQDMIYTMTATNSGDLPIDEDDLFLVAQTPTGLTFYNSATAEFGGEVIGFTAGSSGLTFDPANDLRFVTGSTPPTQFTDCTYTPSSGYDPAISFICINPKGTMTASGNPSVVFQYRFRIE